MKEFVLEYLDFVVLEKNLSKNTISAYRNDFDDFINFLNKKNITSIEDLNYEVIKEYLVDISHREMQSSSINRKISSISGFFKFLAKEKITKTNLFEKPTRPKMPQKLPKIIKFDILDDIFNKLYSVKTTNLDLRNCLIFSLLFKTGIRVSELIKIKLKHVNFNEDFILITGKGDKERTVALTEGLKRLISEYVEKNSLTPVDYLFKSRGKSGYLTREMAGKIVKKITSQFAIEQGVSPHKLRHAFAKYLLDKGLDIREVQELLGHADISTTSIYTKINENEKTELLLKFHPMLKK